MTDLATFYSVSYDQRFGLPETSAVYVLMVGLKPLYVGASSNLRQRILNHPKVKDRNPSEVYYLPTPVAKLREVEGQVITDLQPLLNVDQYSNYPVRRTSKGPRIDIHIYLPPKLAKAIAQVARNNRRSITAEIEIAIERYVALEDQLAKEAKKIRVKSKRNNPSA